MLVISRAQGEAIEISVGGTRLALISVQSIRGTGRVRLGIEAPDHVRISRPDEVLELPAVSTERRPA